MGRDVGYIPHAESRPSDRIRIRKTDQRTGIPAPSTYADEEGSSSPPNHAPRRPDPLTSALRCDRELVGGSGVSMAARYLCDVLQISTSTRLL